MIWLSVSIFIFGLFIDNGLCALAKAKIISACINKGYTPEQINEGLEKIK